MFTREESSRIKEEFWTTFGRYMNPILSSQGEAINWVNYHTKLKDVHFRMDAGQKSATISISIEHRDQGIQALYFEQFLEFQHLLHAALNETWQWDMQALDSNNKMVSRIYTTLPNVSVFNKDHWPALISFFKSRIIALDEFWEDARYSFESLK